MTRFSMIALFIVLLVVACGTQSNTTSDGSLTLSVQWPTAFKTQTIPATTDRIDVEISGQGLTSPRQETIKRRQSGEEKIKLNLPVGPKVVKAKALSKDTQILAIATTQVVIEAYKTTQATLDLQPLSAEKVDFIVPPITPSASPVAVVASPTASPTLTPIISVSAASEPTPVPTPNLVPTASGQPQVPSPTPTPTPNTAVPTPTPTPSNFPTITSITPSQGAIGTSVTLSGSNFNGTTLVKFNGTNATFNINSDATMTTTVPIGATTGTISVTNQAGTSATSVFTVQTTATIVVKAPTGNNFNSLITLKVDNSNVFPASTITAGTDTGTISVGVPGAWTIKAMITGLNNGISETMSLTVDKSGNITQSTGTNTNPFVLPPVITALNISTAAIGESLTITGDGFDSTLTNNTISFGEKTTNPSTASTTSLSVTVPTGITAKTAKEIKVTVNSKTSNKADFSLKGVFAIAGTGASGATNNDNALLASFDVPHDIIQDTLGNFYISDTGNHCIRKLDTNRKVTTFVGLCTSSGSTDGAAGVARFNMPKGMFIDSANNIYVADFGNHRIRKITPTGVVSTVAGSTQGFLNGEAVDADALPGNEAQFNNPSAIAIDILGKMYVVDRGNHCIRKIDGNNVTTFVGNCTSPGGAGNFNTPTDIVFDGNQTLYISDTNNNRIQKVLLDSTTSSEIGTGLTAPTSLALNKAKTDIYIGDTATCIQKSALGSSTITLFAGLCGTVGATDGTLANARFNDPDGIWVDSSDYLYIAESDNYKIRQIIP